MGNRLTITLAQLNPVMGDLAGNADKILALCSQHSETDLLLAGELALSGYPPEDLVLKPSFLDQCHQQIDRICQDRSSHNGPDILLGTPWRDGGKIYNALLLIRNGAIIAKCFKQELPNYGVFDEKRVFAAGSPQNIIEYKGMKLGLLICEDLWVPDIAAHLAKQGADILLVPNGSPFEEGKIQQRLEIAQARYQETGLGILYVNQVGGQDELVFDGGSFILGHDGKIKVRAPQFQEAVLTTEWSCIDGQWQCLAGDIEPDLDSLEAKYAAMVLGLKDYVGKNNFPGILLGLSGGIDSALTAAIAVDALGKDKVRAVMMPSRYTSQESLDDAAACAEFLGIRYDTIKIEPGMESFDSMLAPLFTGLAPDITEENIQARLRGVLLMAISNKTGAMLVTTGNKSEMAVGYATLYGDMCGGYSVLKDVYKTDVFRLAKWRNARNRVMPDNVITKAPTAELRANQKDQDSLPPYDILDQILEHLIEEEMSIDEVGALGYDRGMVKRVALMLDRSEYKRRQAPPGVKLTRRAFGRERRYPITNQFWKMWH